MDIFIKCLNFFGKKTNTRIINGKLYRLKKLKNTSKQIISTIDADEYDKLIHSYPIESKIRKALENETLFVEMIYRLNLHRMKPCSILDIGSHAGLFPFICKYYGHQAIASDLEEVLNKHPNKSLLQLFSIRHIPLKILPFKPLPELGQRFDLVTGFRTRFHSRLPFETGKADEEHWGVKEWTFFLHDLASHHLTDQGQIFFMLNRLQERNRGKIIPKPLNDLFLEKGGKLKYHLLHFKSLDILRRS
jgi:hypothetical protein